MKRRTTSSKHREEAATARLDTVPGLRPEDEERNTGLRWALGAAVLIHALLFLVHFPNLYSPPEAHAQAIKVYKVEPFRPKPPDQPPPTPLPQRRAKKVFVPDATPDDPEPIRKLEIAEDVVEFEDLVLAPGFIPAAPAPPDPGILEVKGDVEKPVQVSGARPQYTEMARRARLEGTVILRAIIDTHGSVIDLEIKRDPGLGLGKAAVEAVKNWQFRPATLNGKPVAVYYHLTVRFSLE